MQNLELAARKAFKRHAEALLIIAFLLADYFLSGWAVVGVTIGALAYLVVPAIPTFLKLDIAGRITFVKALVRTPKAQRTGIIWFWLVAIRWLVASAHDASLWDINGSDSIINLLLVGVPRELAPISFVTLPFVVYGVVALFALALRAGLKPTTDDPDLVKRRQVWCGVVQAAFMVAFLGSIASIFCNPVGPGYMVSNWLMASACDANLFPPDGWAGDRFLDPSFMARFDTFIVSFLSLLAFVFLLQPALKLNALLTSFCWRVQSATSLQNLIEALLEAMHLPKRALVFREAHPLVLNSVRTVAWVVACYAALFWIFGFMGGPVGLGIHNWILASAVDASLSPPASSPNWLWGPEFRMFVGSIVALYGAGPIAVTAATLLPFAGTRKIVLNADGLLFSQGPYVALLGRQFRLWTDLKRVTAKRTKGRKGKLSAQFKLTFRSGGSITFTSAQVAPQDIHVLLDSVNEYASACEVESEVFVINQELIDAEPQPIASDGITGGGIASAAPQDFRSTIFVPWAAGECIPGTKIRITKQLASKPLCAVYLARDEQGRMVVVKQFYLADENDETRALKKTLDREYELLSRLEHPGLAKVFGCFTEGKSTYLIIEHRIGGDLREVVIEHGPRSESATIAWAKQMCEIMIYLHGQNPAVLHRDLTPDNVIAGEDGRLRLIDFGAAREFLEGITGTMLGKHCYVAPEQLRGEATQRSDIYSFGGTLYFLLTGRDPVALKESSPAERTAVSDELDELVRDCTQFDEEGRPQNFEEILSRLNKIGRGFWIKLPEEKKETVGV